MKALAIAAAAVLLALPPLMLVLPATEAATTRALQIDTASARPTVPFKAFDGNPPKLFDINGDGRMEIIAQNDNQYVYVFDSATGAMLAQIKTDFPPGWGARSMNGPEAAVFDSAGTVRVVLLNSAAVLTMYRFDPGASSGGHFGFVKEWSQRLTLCHSNPGSDSKPVLADLDRDGRFEVVVSTEEQGIYAYRQDGSLYWKKCMGGGNGEPTVGDLNLDGWPEVVFGSDGGLVSALNGRTGAMVWSYYVPAHFTVGAGSMPVGVAIGQVDGAGGPDVVVGVRDSHDDTDWTQDHALLLALDSSGRLLWAFQDPLGNPLTYTHPIIVDADRDGTNEIYWADWNTIGHKPPWNEADSWKVTGPAHFYRLDHRGGMVWRQTLSTYWNNKDLAVADADGDGVQEVLANGPGTGGDGIWYLDSRTGAKEAFVATTHWKVARGPVVGDLAGDGGMRWAVGAGAADSTVSGGAILVYDTHVPYSSAWPHLPYPMLGPALPPPPPPSGTFDATFTIKSPNEWWQEVFVRPSDGRPIANVQMRISGGPWEDMARSSWGAWTASVHTVAGTRVEFLAIDAGNAQSQSLPFTWMDGQLTKGSTTPSAPPPPGFTATFEVSKNVNTWWVEVTVRSSDAIQAVDARVNGGSWVALSPTSWGTWAKSFNVPSGSQVQFRATSSAGATATSGTTTWP